VQRGSSGALTAAVGCQQRGCILKGPCRAGVQLLQSCVQQAAQLSMAASKGASMTVGLQGGGTHIQSAFGGSWGGGGVRVAVCGGEGRGISHAAGSRGCLQSVQCRRGLVWRGAACYILDGGLRGRLLGQCGACLAATWCSAAAAAAAAAAVTCPAAAAAVVSCPAAAAAVVSSGPVRTTSQHPSPTKHAAC